MSDDNDNGLSTWLPRWAVSHLTPAGKVTGDLLFSSREEAQRIADEIWKKGYNAFVEYRPQPPKDDSKGNTPM